MLTAATIIIFIIIGLTLGFYCDRYFGDPGVFIATALYLPVAFIAGQALNYLINGECVVKSDLENTLNSFLMWC